MTVKELSQKIRAQIDRRHLRPRATKKAGSIFVEVPEGDPIELISYYDHFKEYYRNCEPQSKRWCQRHIQPDWQIFDVGANIGYYTALFSRLASSGKVAAYEPTSTIDMLRQNLENLGVDGVETHQIALGEVCGFKEESVYRIWGHPPETKGYSFSSVDHEMDRLGWSRLDLLKIDVDSFDFEVLRGAKRTIAQFNPWVLVELNHALSKRGQSAGDAFEWLARQGYEQALQLDSENYLLRRPDKAQSSPSLRIVFDREPIFELAQRPVCTGEEVELQTLSAKLSEGAERVGTGNSYQFVGPAWAYALTLPIATSKQVPALVSIEIQAINGIASVLVIDEDGAKLGDEVEVRAPASKLVQIYVSDISLVGAVIVRNTASPSDILKFSHSLVRAYHANLESPDNLPYCYDSGCDHIDVRALARKVDRTATAANKTIPIVNVQELDKAFKCKQAFFSPSNIVEVPIVNLKMEDHDAIILEQIYRWHQPARHLEFGTWQGFGTKLCAESCDAHIWTINLPEGERDLKGNAAYQHPDGTASDCGAQIGSLYREAGLEDRVTQILANSTTWESKDFHSGFFNSALIDGGHTPDVVASDSINAFRLVKSGGLIMWHDFCPDETALQHSKAARGVVQAICENWADWHELFSKVFWIRPSWLLVGIKK